MKSSDRAPRERRTLSQSGADFLKSAVEEIWSLFVDDPAFVALIVLWAVAIRFGRAYVPIHAAGPTLFAGFAVLLLIFTCRKAAKTRVA